MNPKMRRRQVVEYRVVCAQTIHEFRIIVSRKARESTRCKKKGIPVAKLFVPEFDPPPFPAWVRVIWHAKGTSQLVPFCPFGPLLFTVEKEGKEATRGRSACGWVFFVRPYDVVPYFLLILLGKIERYVQDHFFIMM